MRLFSNKNWIVDHIIFLLMLFIFIIFRKNSCYFISQNLSSIINKTSDITSDLLLVSLLSLFSLPVAPWLLWLELTPGKIGISFFNFNTDFTPQSITLHWKYWEIDTTNIPSVTSKKRIKAIKLKICRNIGSIKEGFKIKWKIPLAVKKQVIFHTFF